MKILVAGAAGYVGRHTVDELKRRRHWVRALVRSTKGTWTSKPDEVVTADVLETPDLKPICDGVDLVISTLGGNLTLDSPDKTPYKISDEIANGNLLHGAIAARVKRFTYVSVFGHYALGDTAYVSAHESFIQRLRDARMEFQVVRPTGLFYVYGELVKLARKGRAMVVGDGSARTNPVHEADVAAALVDLVESDEKSVEVGGPKLYSRAELVQLAFAAIGKPAPKIRKIPAGLIRLGSLVTRPFNRRLAELLEFGAAAGTNDVVAPEVGTQELEPYLRDLSRP